MAESAAPWHSALTPRPGTWWRASVLEILQRGRAERLSIRRWLRHPVLTFQEWVATPVWTETRRRRWNRTIRMTADRDPLLADLDPDQRAAASCFEDRTIVTAGAGSGKTRTMVARAAYAATRLEVEPSRIAFVTFTTKAAAEIRSRTQERLPGLAVGTIHQLARLLVRAAGKPAIQLSGLADDEDLRTSRIQRWLAEASAKDPSLIVDRWTRLNAVYTKTDPAGPVRRHRVPPDGRLVKSHGEVVIATLLHQAGLLYRYEATFPTPPDDAAAGVRDYHPDFYIPDDPDPAAPVTAEGGIWLEHYAHDRAGKAPARFTGYDAERTWKRALHDRLSTRYAETSFGDLQRAWDGDGPTMAEVLTNRLRGAGKEMDDPEWWPGAAHPVGEPPNASSRLAREIGRWISMHRQRPAGIEPMLDPESDEAALRRLGRAVLGAYEAELNETRTNDHDGTILAGTETALARPDLIPWEQIIVDEYQDVNPAQAAFLHALTTPPRPERPGAVLACVGDDWQSIFGFQGGDPRLISSCIDPAGRVHSTCERVALAASYRFGEKLAGAARVLTAADPRCSTRTVHGLGPDPVDDAPAVEVASCGPTPEATETGTAKDARTPATAALKIAIEHWIPVEESQSDEPVSVLVMGRRNIDVMDPPPERTHRTGIELGSVDALAASWGVQMEYRTIHGAKGSEADYAILIDSGPSAARSRADQRALDRAIAAETGYEDDDEHRLWYVAVTRGRRAALVLVVNADGGASKATETLLKASSESIGAGPEVPAPGGIDWSLYGAGAPKTGVHRWLEPVRAALPCPGCNPDGTGEGRLKSTAAKNRHFAGCSEWIAGDDDSCGYTQPACESCGAGLLERTAQDTFKCREPACGAEVPACHCNPPRPMAVRRQKKTGDRFWGCWRFGEPDACGRTKTID